MEHPPDPRNISRDQKCLAAAGRTVPSRTRQGTKLRDMLMSDKPNLSYADFHHEITRNADDTLPKYVGSKKSQALERTTSKEDELVRYMSNLPTYLEKGMNSQEKALNVGVLDWKRLEKWRYSHKQMPHKNNGCSPSSSNTSLFSTDGSSPHSSRGQSCSPASQRMRRLSLQSPLEASPREGHVLDAKTSPPRGHSCSPAHQRLHKPVAQSHPHERYAGRGKSQDIDVLGINSGKFQDSPVSTGDHLCRQQKVLRALQHCERKDSDLKSVSEMGQRLTFDKYEVPAPWKGKTKIQGSESTKQTLKLQDTKLEAADRDRFRRESSGVHIKPIDQSESSCSGVATSSDFAVYGQLSVEQDGKTISERNNSGAPRPYKIDSNKHSRAAGSSSKNREGVKYSSQDPSLSLHSTKMFQSPSRISAQGVKGPSPASHMLSFPARMFSSPSKSRNIEEMQPVTGIRSASAAKPYEELDVRKNFESNPKVRNPSPIRRLSFAMGKMIKNAGSRDNSPLRRSSSKDCVARSGSEGAIPSSSIDSSSSDKSTANNNRGRSSPLRRLLDPLLKPRPSSSSEPSKKHSSPTVGTVKSCNDQLPGNSLKGKSRSAVGRTSVSDSHHNSKSGSSSIQALLQVSFKNGFPLFTFAIDNESDILAATVRKSFVPGKGHSWTYTFFTVREIKRKSGIWLSQGGKSDGHGYVPNVVAQMKVSDSHGSRKHENADDHITREFDLFAVEGHGDQYATDFHPTNELAAIVIKLPRSMSENPSKDDQSGFDWLDSSHACFRENLEETRLHADSDDNSQSDRSFGSLKLSTTVILPGGVHTVPSRGEISTLAQRWRSGGSCDCGGWDLGCQLQVLSNRRGYETKLGSSVACLSKDKFQLFSQVGPDNQLMLSLAPFKERIYSVEFNSSLSLLQAFAICISYIDCRRPAEPLGLNNVVDKITDEVGVFEVPIRMKTSNHQVDAPARYVSYPPHSPVGRV